MKSLTVALFAIFLGTSLEIMYLTNPKETATIAARGQAG